MPLLLHIIIALTSLALSAGTYFRPSRRKLRLSYSLVALTLTSGTYLVVSTGSPMVSACMSGLLYTGFVAAALGAAHRRLSLQPEENR